MTSFRKIEIDFDVHRAIENERQGFEESENDALRRLLGLPPSTNSTGTRRGGAPWVSGNIELPHGTALRLTYNGMVYEGRIENGKWVVGDESFTTPSGAAGVAVTKKGTRAMLNGWETWQVKRPSDAEWTRLNDLRK